MSATYTVTVTYCKMYCVITMLNQKKSQGHKYVSNICDCKNMHNSTLEILSALKVGDRLLSV